MYQEYRLAYPSLQDLDGMIAEITELAAAQQKRQDKLDDYEKNKKWNVDNLSQVVDEKTIINAGAATKTFDSSGYALPTGTTTTTSSKDSAGRGKKETVTAPTPPSAPSSSSNLPAPPPSSSTTSTNSSSSSTTTGPTPPPAKSGPVSEKEVSVHQVAKNESTSSDVTSLEDPH